MKFKFGWSGSVVVNHTGFDVTCTSHLNFSIRRSAKITDKTINKIISSTEYLVYLCLIRNLQNNTNVTYETIADNLGMDESNVGTAIRGLYDAGAITIDKSYNEK